MARRVVGDFTITGRKMHTLVLVELKDGIGLITLVNDSSVRAVLIRGTGKHFCVGGDVKWFAELGDRLPEGLDGILAVLNPLLFQLLNLPVPQ
ncbi:MAG: hypothetical protein ABSF90_29025 [Syntrophobacteraceae bacterium]